MAIEHSIEYQEREAAKEILPELNEHLDYSTKIYNSCFSIQRFLDGKTINDVGQLLRSQMMILMRITDFLRCIQHIVILGYPEQACTLAASIFELSHTAVYFSYDNAAMLKWLASSDGEKNMPKLIGIDTYKKLVEHNCQKVGVPSEPEVSVYRQLCWMKHSHPIMQDIQINNDKAKFLIGPFTDERSISHAWFAIEQSGRLTEMLISHIVFPKGLLSDSDLNVKRQMLLDLTNMRDRLNKKAQARFNILAPE
ncbi:hypothetical protein BN59_00388 [Legionella massiliensis]|uniref:Uncharacterized protein n=1 Tax=Legionella massiliensis TaxID=1034943 RepID=A0A078KT40_9GAMM|nr:hypothetical protein [Legionella massiliensis]CDZ76122.1 hypothetical protein BN59_00388 [Legionella massiliensis]CEE11860.1 hypothetical protein BN1094_00388 [Legionella massiliensis]